MTFRVRGSKYRNTRTEYNGRKYDSKFEAGVARDLDVRKQAGEILDWEPQFHVVMTPHDETGKPLPKLAVRHRIDFRAHNLDGTFELIEAKGVETADYRRRRKWLEEIWLPAHPDHTYTVIKDRGRNWTLPKGKGRAA